MKILRSLTVYIIFVCIPMLARETIKQTLLPLAITPSVGVGKAYGGSYGLGLDLEYPVQGLHHLSVIGGLGKENAHDDFWLNSYGVRYAYGVADRVICDIMYGTTEVKERWGSLEAYDGEYHDTEHVKIISGFSLMTGYQRITPFGMVMLLEAGFRFDRGKNMNDPGLCASFSLGYRI